MADLGLTECCGESKLRFEIWFRRRKARDLFVLQASDVATKQAWTADISRLLWRQAVHNKGESLYKPPYMSSQGSRALHTLWGEREGPRVYPARDWAWSRDLEKLGKRGGAGAADGTGKEHNFSSQYQRSCALKGTL